VESNISLNPGNYMDSLGSGPSQEYFNDVADGRAASFHSLPRNPVVPVAGSLVLSGKLKAGWVLFMVLGDLKF
jgi:hypothetical protein